MIFSDLGFTVQRYICNNYKIKIPDEAKAQFDSAYNPEYDTIVKNITSKIFLELNSKPVKCLTFSENENDGEKYSRHNFLLDNGLTMSIKTNKKESRYMQAPQIIGQAGYVTLNYHFGHLVNNIISSQKDIKNLIWYKSSEVLPIFLDYLLISDITVWIYNSSIGYDFKIIYRSNKPDMMWDQSKISFSRPSIKDWNESNSIRYLKKSIAEAQVHKNRTFKFRFNMSNLIIYLEKEEINNETLGITAEKVVCDLNKLKYPDHLYSRSSTRMEMEIKPTLNLALNEIPTPYKYVGAEKGDRGENSKSPYDFVLADNKTLSLKTNKGEKVCPPEVGQPSKQTFLHYFGHLIDEEFTDITFKKLCLYKTSEMMKIYLFHLLDSDYLLWLFWNKDHFEYEIVQKLAFDFEWDQREFTFTQDEDSWNESNTVKYKGISIGEFQIHQHRNSYKFRFNMRNLLNVIKSEH